MSLNDLPHWSAWAKGGTNQLVDRFQLYCVEHMDEIYEIMTSSKKYHGVN